MLALSCAIAVAAAARADSSAAPAATANFSGGNASETIVARAKGKTVRLEASDASGKRLARAEAPAPGGRNPTIALATGSIGSVGTLLEVTASGDGTVCRSVWRLRDGALSRLPILDRGKQIPDCEGQGVWISRWDETHNEPARYVRERTRETPQGRLHESQVFVFAGSELQHDAKRSDAEINGVPIPDWYDAKLYPKSELEALFKRFALTGFRNAVCLRFDADRERGVFALRFSDREGEIRLPVTASRPLEKEEPGVELVAGDPAVLASVTLARGSIPQDVVVKGAGPRFDGAYAPVIHWNPNRIRVYPDAEQELASEALPGNWATEKDEHISIEVIAAPGAIRFGDKEVSLRLDGAPEGADLLLVPQDGGPPAWALALRGPNAFLRIPIRCTDGAAARECRTAGEGQSFRRIGSQMNVR